MKYINGRLFINGCFSCGSFEVEDGRFGKILTGSREKDPCSADSVTDLKGALVLPGLIDIHTHGNSGFDFSTCDLNGLTVMASYLARNGITSFAPTSMTMPYDDLEKAFQNARALKELQETAQCSRSCACCSGQDETPACTSRIAGINMEGPYFSYGKRGAQDPSYLKLPDLDGFYDLYRKSGELIKLVDIAPELEGADAFIRQARRFCTVSVAHTQADYDTARNAFENGASHITHLFNGMNSIHHRNPGPVCAAFDCPSVFAELICDGIHIAPPVIRMVFNLFKGRVILISDALACCGMPDGNYSLGDQHITLKDHHATLPDGTLAGSASNLFDMMKNAISFGIPVEEAITAATLNPARQLKADSEIGSIETGKKADFLVCTESLQLESVYLNGVQI